MPKLRMHARRVTSAGRAQSRRASIFGKPFTLMKRDTAKRLGAWRKAPKRTPRYEAAVQEGLDDELDAAWSNLNVEKRSNWDSPIMAAMISVRSGSMERNPAVWNRRGARELKSLCQYIRGQWLLVRFLQSISAQISGRTLTGSAIGDEIKGDFLALVEAIHPCTLNGADVNEHVLASVGRLNEAKSLLAVEPLYDPLHH
jgi:hypothetical protein